MTKKDIFKISLIVGFSICLYTFLMGVIHIELTWPAFLPLLLLLVTEDNHQNRKKVFFGGTMGLLLALGLSTFIRFGSQVIGAHHKTKY